jgi:tetratricopeptide (TPR) repeat protein
VERAIEYHEAALAIAQEIGDRRGEGARLGSLGLAYHALGQVERAIEYYQDSLAIAQEIGNRLVEGNALGNLGNAHLALRQVERAIAYYQDALAIAQEIGDRRVEALLCWSLGVLYEESDPARAVELMSVRVAYEREIGHLDAEAHAEQVAQIQARLN